MGGQHSFMWISARLDTHPLMKSKPLPYLSDGLTGEGTEGGRFKDLTTQNHSGGFFVVTFELGGLKCHLCPSSKAGIIGGKWADAS